MKANVVYPEKQDFSRFTGAKVKVWDEFVRLFHWTQLLLVLGLVASGQLGAQEIHQFLGFSLAVIVIARLVWGFVGSQHARFRNFVTSPAAALAYLRAIVAGRPARHLGHNPAGGWMVLALLSTLLVLLASGIVLQATLEFSGPLVELCRGIDDQDVHRLLELHEIALNLLYLLVPLHLLGVLLASRQHGENLVGAMLTGYKPTHTER